MKTVTFTEFRNHARKYFDKVEKGETVEIYRKGKPSAVLASARPAGKKNWKPAVPIKIEGFSLSKAILEEREESAS